MDYKTDEEYAQKFLDVPNLVERGRDSLDFHDVSVGAVRSMLITVIADRNLSYTEANFPELVHTTLWDATDGGVVVRGSDSLDFHDVPVWGISSLLAKLH